MPLVQSGQDTECVLVQYTINPYIPSSDQSWTHLKHVALLLVVIVLLYAKLRTESFEIVKIQSVNFESVKGYRTLAMTNRVADSDCLGNPQTKGL
jgi:hypothetical protein